MAGKGDWTKGKEDALKALIRETIAAAGHDDPATLPHRVRERLKGRATGELDIDAYIREVVEQQRRRDRSR